MALEHLKDADLAETGTAGLLPGRLPAGESDLPKYSRVLDPHGRSRPVPSDACSEPPFRAFSKSTTPVSINWIVRTPLKKKKKRKKKKEKERTNKHPDGHGVSVTANEFWVIDLVTPGSLAGSTSHRQRNG